MEQNSRELPAESRVEMKEAKLVRNTNDSVFTTLFSTKESLLDLHRTLHPSDVSVTERDITPVALENVMTNDLYNDVAYLVEDRLIILAEHQSTINENMPLRMLIYLAREYERIVYGRENSGKIYNEKLIKIPQPEFYVVYTGKTDWNKSTLRLSEAFPNPKSCLLELEVAVISRINELKQSSKLNGYFQFIQRAQSFLDSGLAKRDSIIAAIDSCIEDGILVDFLSMRREEIVTMLTKEFDLIEYGNVKAEEAIEKTTKKFVIGMLKKGMSSQTILELSEVSPKTFKIWKQEFENQAKETNGVGV